MSGLAALGQLRTKLADELAGAAGIPVHPYPVDKPAGPCGFVDWSRETLTFTDALGSGCFDLSEVRFRVCWLVGKALADGPGLLDALVDLTLDTVGGMAEFHGPYDWSPPRPTIYADITYLMAELVVRANL